MKSCIIAGEGNLPILLAEKNKDFFVIAIKSLAVLSSFENKAYMVDMHDFNEMIKIFKTHDIRKIIFAGKFYRQKKYNKNIPKELSKILDETKFYGDDSTLKKIKKFFEKNGFEVVSLNTLINHNFQSNEIIFNKKLGKIYTNKDLHSFKPLV